VAPEGVFSFLFPAQQALLEVSFGMLTAVVIFDNLVVG
jgi:hypothetical protein